jgi:hypothetical protein
VPSNTSELMDEAMDEQHDREEHMSQLQVL